MYPETSIKLYSPKPHVKAESKQLTRLARNSISVSRKISEPWTEVHYQTARSLAHSKDLQWK
jgi:hypothetical protein